MGTMGSTQGVNASSKPASQNAAMVRSRLPEARVEAMESVAAEACSPGGAAGSGSPLASVIRFCAAPRPVSATCKRALPGG